MAIIPYQTHYPKIANDAFVAPDAWITGKVELKKLASVFFACSLRGDINNIIVGEESNIQEGSILHTSRGLGDCIIGNQVTVGHAAIIHGATIKDRCIIGMGSTILDNAIIEEDCMIGANSLVTMNTIIPRGSLALGSPAKVVRKLTDKEIQGILDSAASYVRVSQNYKLQF